MSRSTWACELKLSSLSILPKFQQSRSTWACELKLSVCQFPTVILSHAPRERVSWNPKIGLAITNSVVTLHVSVWVEIPYMPGNFNSFSVTLHVSVWVEICIVYLWRPWQIGHAPRERVSWNYCICQRFWNCSRHAPRERVSWNTYKICQLIKVHVTLHVSVWVEIKFIPVTHDSKKRHAPRERVSWNLQVDHEIIQCNGHAPRERVSWNPCAVLSPLPCCVTLHVSVWVEILRTQFAPNTAQVTLHVSVWVEISASPINFLYHSSRSTWACELKYDTGIHCYHEPQVTLHVSVWVEIPVIETGVLLLVTGHAPRERVSWNAHVHIKTVHV